MELIDCSNVQGTVDWKAVARDGVTGVFLKATEGVTYTDALFAGNRAQAGRAGLRVGAYHFARPDRNPSSPVAEANHFCATVGKLARRDLRPVLDLEVDASEVHRQELAWWARKFSGVVKDKLGVWPLLYGSTSYLAELRLTSPILGGLWLANYGPNDGRRHVPAVPAPWRKAVCHQYSSVGTCAGVRGHVDRSYAARVQPLLAHPVTGFLPGGRGGGKASTV